MQSSDGRSTVLLKTGVLRSAWLNGSNFSATRNSPAVASRLEVSPIMMRVSVFMIVTLAQDLEFPNAGIA